MTIIEIRPFRNGWKVFEAPRVEPVFLSKEQAMTTPLAAHAFALARFAFWIQTARSNGPFRLTRRIENCDSELVYRSRLIFLAVTQMSGTRNGNFANVVPSQPGAEGSC